MKFVVDTEKINYNTLLSIAKDIGYKEGSLFEWLENNTKSIDLDLCWDDPEWEIEKNIIDALDAYDSTDIREWIDKAPKDIWDDEDVGGNVGTLEANYNDFCNNRKWKIAHCYAEKAREDLECCNSFWNIREKKYLEMQDNMETNKINFEVSRIHPEITSDNKIEYTIDWVNKEK